MHQTNMKQTIVRKMSGSNHAEASKPSARRDELSALRAWLLLKMFLRARSVVSPAKRTLSVMVIGAMLVTAGSVRTLAVQQPDGGQGEPPAQQTPAELQQLVAPVALYPDALVAQILAASTYPTQIVEAERWLQKHSKLQGEELGREVDQESWDPSVKALTPFPSVLARMNENLSWTSAVGDAYFNQEQDVLDAVQVMRKRAEDAGTLRSTPQQRVATQGSTIIIEPAVPDVCYVPVYDPWNVYGAPVAVYPGYIFDSWDGPPFFFGPAIGLGFFAGYGWGWPAWGFNWGRRQVIFNHNIYVSRSPSFVHRFPGGRDFRPGGVGSSSRGNHDVGGRDQSRGNGFDNRDSGRGRNEGTPNPNFDRGHGRNDGAPNTNFDRGHSRNDAVSNSNSDRGHGRNDGGSNPNLDRGHGGGLTAPDAGSNHREFRGFGDGRSTMGTRSGAFSGFGQGGIERGFASRGQSSFGRGGFGGGDMRGGGGGGMRGGGGGGGHNR